MRYLPACLVTSLVASPSLGSVTVITNRTQWLNVVGSHDYIGFTEYPEFTVITTQYAEQGVTFSDGNDFIFVTPSFPSDGHGLVSSDRFAVPGNVHMDFSESQYACALDFTDVIQVEFYDHGTLIYASPFYVAGFTPFVGFISTGPFDRVVAFDFTGGVITVDNIYFNALIPAPGVLLTIAAGLAITRTRRGGSGSRGRV